MFKFLPLLLLLVGAGAGIAAGHFMAPRAGHDDAEAENAHPKEDNEAHETTEFVKLNNQFVVPIVQSDRVASLVVMSLSLETRAGSRERVFEREPKLRDMFLRVLFDHANMGGFDGAFTRPGKLDVLRQSLADVARKELGDDVSGVLITEIARQDN
ncbi:flagellar basal body-associated FliL family protein [Sedimentitalea sp. XS_ASV28]|uniref:flagellar basal body-associated FliL family protein n=1 Tax=Sedimentitalea sp. XS_ASV28 TaxID=3241296 RepID=UPI00351402FE